MKLPTLRPSLLALTLRSREVTVLTGRSGSGKTTLLTMLTGLLTPSGGTVSLDSRDLYRLSDTDLSKLRAKYFAVIPQGASAISSLTVIENILFPAALAGKKPLVREAETIMERRGILPFGIFVPVLPAAVLFPGQRLDEFAVRSAHNCPFPCRI